MENNWEYILTLYSNLALLNAVKYTKIQKDNKDKEISEKNFDHHFVLNKAFQNTIEKSNKRNDNKIDIKKFREHLSGYLRNIRNYYSHLPENDTYKVSEQKLKENENDINYQLKTIFINTSEAPVVKNFKKEEWRIFVIAIFLTTNEYNDFLSHINNNELEGSPINKDLLLKLELSFSIFKKMRFRLKKVVHRKYIHFKVLHYITSFKNIKNKKDKFIKLAISLLNWHFKTKGLQFGLHHKNKYLVEIKNNSTQKDFFVNFYTLSKILLLKPHFSKDFFYNPQFQLQEFEGKETKSNDNFKTFINRYKSSSLIDARHLLKTFHKVLNYEQKISTADTETNTKSYFHQNNFEIIYQFLVSNDKTLLNDHIKDQLNQIFNCSTPEWEQDLPAKMKSYILNYVNDNESHFNNLFQKDQQTDFNHQKNKVKNDKLLFLTKEMLNKIDYVAIYEKFFDFKDIKNANNKEELNSIKKYIAPIVIFYDTIFNKTNDDKKLNVENLLKNTDDLILEKEIIIKIFNNRILENKNQISLRYLNKEINLDWQDWQSHYEILNSKLFWEIYYLLKKDRDFKELQDKNLILEVLKKYDWYTKKELDLVRKTKKWDNHKIEYLNKVRNYVFHRNISKFPFWKKIEYLLQDRKQNRSGHWQQSKHHWKEKKYDNENKKQNYDAQQSKHHWKEKKYDNENKKQNYDAQQPKHHWKEKKYDNEKKKQDYDIQQPHHKPKFNDENFNEEIQNFQDKIKNE